MAPTAAYHCGRVLDNLERVLAVELLCAAQGVDFRRELLGDEARLGRGTRAAYEQVRALVPFMERDAPPAPHMEALTGLVNDGRIVAAVEAALAR